MKRLSSSVVSLCAAVLAAAACSPTPNILPSNDLNRPTDMTFLCLGAFDQGGVNQVSGRPMWINPEMNASDAFGR